jgi:hypothetical protein
MKTRRILIIFFYFLLAGQLLFAQTNYNGKVNFNKKDNSFALVSAVDSFDVMIDKKGLKFNNQDDFFFIKTKKNNYNLVKNDETVSIKDTKKQIKYSTGLVLYPVKKKKRELIIKDINGNIVLSAKFILRKGISNFNIAIFDKKHKAELLAYATHYLYSGSKNIKEANYNPYLYFYLF